MKAAEEAGEAEVQYKDGVAAMATYKASQATWKASQAADAAAVTETCALQAASEARAARTSEALQYALEAAQHYNEVNPTFICFHLLHRITYCGWLLVWLSSLHY